MVTSEQNCDPDKPQEEEHGWQDVSSEVSEAGLASLKALVLPGKEMETCGPERRQGEGSIPASFPLVPTLTPCASLGDHRNHI